MYCQCRAAPGMQSGGAGNTDRIGYLYAPGSPVDQWLCGPGIAQYLLVGIERIINAAFLFFILAIAIALAYTVIL